MPQSEGESRWNPGKLLASHLNVFRLVFHDLIHSQLNKRLPYFFRDRTTEYFGLIHAALFGSETVELEEAERLLGISKETVAQLKQYEEEREDMEVSRL